MANNFPELMTFAKPQAQKAQEILRRIKTKNHLGISYYNAEKQKQRKILKEAKQKKNKYKNYSRLLVRNHINKTTMEIFKVLKGKKKRRKLEIL